MPKIAVILVPGIMGSPLINKHGHEAWPIHEMRKRNIFNLAWWTSIADVQQKVDCFVDVNDDLRSITRPLTANVGQRNRFGVDSPFNRAQNVAYFYYDFMVGLRDKSLKGPADEPLTFIANDYLVHVANYDWARPLLESVPQLIQETQRFCIENHCTQFMYLTHSMGGIAAMAALAKDLWIQTTCLGIVRVACPVQGAPETMARLVRGIESGETIIEQATARMLGNSGRKFSLFAACIQGLASLLPQFCDQDINLKTVRIILDYHFQNKMAKSSDDDEQLAYQLGTTLFPKLVQRFNASITDATTVWRALVANRDLIDARTFAVALTGKTTLQDYVVNPSFPNGWVQLEPQLRKSLQGDGTVPVWSQLTMATRSIQVPGGIDHADAYEDKRVWPHIISAMNELFTVHSPEGQP